MFEDFHPAANSEEARKRMGTSMAAAFFLYGGLFVGTVAATATARQVLEDEETQVEFVQPAPEPEPPPPPEVTPAVQAMRPAVKRPKLTPPVKVSDEKLKESNKDLAPSEAAGPVEGSLDGVEGGLGTGRAPPPPPKVVLPLKLPVALSSNAFPRYSPKAKRKGIEGSVVVTFDVTAAGTVQNVRIVSGAPELIELVMRTVPTWRFKPATRDGKAIPYRKTQTITFRLEDA